MKMYITNMILTAVVTVISMTGLQAQCRIALDEVDEFDSTLLIAAEPINIGHMVVSGNVPEDLEGKEYVEEAKAVFSFTYQNRIRSFFLTLGVVEHKFHMIDTDYTVFLKFGQGQIVRLLNVPSDAEFNRDILMWKYVHTCVIPIEVFQMMKNDVVEKIRINYKNYKKTISLEPDQQKALQEVVKCVEKQLAEGADKPKP